MKDPLWETYKFIFKSALEDEAKGAVKYPRPSITILLDGNLISGQMATFEDYLACTSVLAAHFNENSVAKMSQYFLASDDYLFLNKPVVISGNEQLDLPGVMRINVSHISAILDGGTSTGNG